MNKEIQRQTIYNIHVKLSELFFRGSDSKLVVGILDALSQVHDALAEEIRNNGKSSLEVKDVGVS